jgi:hypothetical protein
MRKRKDLSPDILCGLCSRMPTLPAPLAAGWVGRMKADL